MGEAVEKLNTEGESELTNFETEFLDKNGYILLEDVLSSEELSDIRERLDGLLLSEGPDAGNFSTKDLRTRLFERSGPFAAIKLRIYDAMFWSSRLAARVVFKCLPDIREAVRDYCVRGTVSPIHGKAFSIRREVFSAIAAETQREQKGVRRLTNLVNKGTEFDRIYTNPRILSGVRRIIGSDFRLSSLNFRSVGPGAGLQALHVDWDMPVPVDTFYACNALWFLVDISPQNGATRVVPGSHRFCRMPQSDLPNPRMPHPDEIILSGRAGSVLLLNSHTWHGGTMNRSERHRPILQSYFVHRACQQQLVQRAYLSDGTRKRLTLEAQWILDA